MKKKMFQVEGDIVAKAEKQEKEKHFQELKAFDLSGTCPGSREGQEVKPEEMTARL